ncbi:MAG: CpsD/CapB family tyrosine-protein kinase, partial [Clostridium sp.]
MLTVQEEPRSLYAESFRTIKTNIKYSSADKDKKVFLVTSPNVADGKSTVAANLAISFSMDNKRVLIIDCDLRKPSIHKKFKLSLGSGLTEVLIGEGSMDNLVHRYSD